MQKGLIVAEIGAPQIITGVLLVVGLIICWYALKKTMRSMDDRKRTSKDFPEPPARWDE